MPDFLLFAGLAYFVTGVALAAASVSKDPPGGQVGIIEACVGFVLLVALLPLAVLLTLFDRRG